MASIIECDIIQSEDGENVQMGNSEIATITWTQNATTNTQAVTIYRLGNVVTLSTAGWKVGPVASAHVITGSVLPTEYWPSVARNIPIEIDYNAGTFAIGSLVISTAGVMTIGQMNGATPKAMGAGANAYNLYGSYLL